MRAVLTLSVNPFECLLIEEADLYSPLGACRRIIWSDRPVIHATNFIEQKDANVNGVPLMKFDSSNT